MSQARKSLIPVLTLLTAVVAFAVGNEIRTRQDVGLSLAALRPFASGSIADKDGTPSMGEAEYFYQLTLLLEREYVDQVKDERKLALGAVRGMVASLLDPESNFYDQAEFLILERERQGKFQGIGAETRLIYDEKLLDTARETPRNADPLLLIPDLVVATVIPGGPADTAGLRTGDRIVQVDGRWLISSSEIRELRKMRADVMNGSADREKLDAIRRQFETRFKNGLMPAKTKRALSIGLAKQRELRVMRAGVETTLKVVTGECTAPVTEVLEGGAVRLRLFAGAPRALLEATKSHEKLVIDLRQSTQGDVGQVIPLLEVLGPADTYGILRSRRAGSQRALQTSTGAKPKPIVLRVDSTTRGAAEILALALAGKGLAKLEGGPMANEPWWVETVRLEDGGYTLTTGRFEVGGTS